MNRSSGVTASAVIAILGSLVSGAMGVFLLFSVLMLASGPGIPNTQTPYPTPIPRGAILAIEAFLFLGSAIFGILSAVSLLRLRNWARISFIVFAVILTFSAGSTFFGGILVMLMPLPPNVEVPQGFMAGIAVVMMLVALAVLALAIWWLIYFNKRNIKAEFMGEAAAALPRRGPLSITVIGWMQVIGAVFTLIPGLLSSYPAVFLGMLLQGWVGRSIYFLWAGASLTAGIGLLKWRRWALAMTIGVYAFALVNTVLSFMTGAITRMNEVVQERMPPTPYPVYPASSIIAFTITLAVAFLLVVFWFLITRRRAFIAACEMPATTTS